MRVVLAVVLSAVLTCSVLAQGQEVEPARSMVLETVLKFYAAFNSHGWDKATEFATEDWNHINPFGGRTAGRASTVDDLKRVHSTFLKGVTDEFEMADIRFATADVAVATVVSRMSTYTTPDGAEHRNDRNIRTFVVVKRSGRWQIMQDHNTIIAP